MARSKKPKKGSWIVRARREIEVELVCEDCTEEEARSDPYSYLVPYADDAEREVECFNFEVLEVEPNV